MEIKVARICKDDFDGDVDGSDLAVFASDFVAGRIVRIS